MENEWFATTEKNIKRYYDHCAITRRQDVYKDYPFFLLIVILFEKSRKTLICFVFSSKLFQSYLFLLVFKLVHILDVVHLNLIGLVVFDLLYLMRKSARLSIELVRNASQNRKVEPNF